MWWTPIVWLACSGGTDPSDDDPGPDTIVNPTGSTGDTGIPVSTGPLSGGCQVQADNSLRADCTFMTQETEALTLTWPGHTRTTAPGTVHEVTLWGIAPQTDVPWEATTASGSRSGVWTSGPLDLPLTFVRTGTSSAEHVFLSANDQVVLHEANGDVIWHQRITLPNGDPLREGVTGATLTADGVALVQIDRTALVAVDMTGTELWRLEQGVDFPDTPLHHDVYARGDELVTLFAEQVPTKGGDFILDGILTFDLASGALRDTWHHSEHLIETPAGGSFGFWGGWFPAVPEFGHANSIHITAEGDRVLGMRHLDAAVKIAGPDRVDAGEVDWVLRGDGSGDFTLATEVGGPADYIGQHHVVVEGDTVTLFDNRNGPAARTVQLRLDGSVATIEAVHDLGLTCSVHGANYPLDNGNVMATCGSQALALEFEPGSDTAVWSFEVNGTFLIARVIPVALPP